MRYVLRDKSTGHYLKSSGVWVARVEEALTFEDSTEAREFCQAHHITEAQLVQSLMPYLVSLLPQSPEISA